MWTGGNREKVKDGKGGGSGTGGKGGTKSLFPEAGSWVCQAGKGWAGEKMDQRKNFTIMQSAKEAEDAGCAGQQTRKDSWGSGKDY